MLKILGILLISIFCACEISYAQDVAMLNSLVERGILTEEEAQDVKKSSAVVATHTKTASKVHFLQFWHIRYSHLSQNSSSYHSYSKDGFAFRRLVPVVIARFTDSTRIMTTLLFPSAKLLNTMRFEHDIDTNYLRGTAWFALDAVFFCMEEPESGMRLMTPDRSIINMYLAVATTNTGEVIQELSHQTSPSLDITLGYIGTANF